MGVPLLQVHVHVRFIHVAHVSVLLLVHGEESENQEVSTHHHESLLL